MNNIALTVLSFGAGQDTMYLLYRFCLDPKFRLKHVAGRLVVIGSDTGCEHDHTYAAIEKAKQLCRIYGIEFYWVTNDMGYHSDSWKSLTHQYKKNSSIGSAAYRQTCTDNLKVKVVDRFLERWIISNYYISLAPHTLRKSVFSKFVEDHGYIRLILGFAAGEESRTSNGNKFDAVWKKKSVIRYYPLIEDSISRQDAINYLEANEELKVYPSNCKICFYMSDQEILWLYRNDPATFYDWSIMEDMKKVKYGDIEKNYGVYGKITLKEKLEKAQRLYGHWTDEQLNEYKYSHGHCMKSKF